MRDAISRSGVAGDDLHICAIERRLKEVGSGFCVSDNVRSHPLWLSVDIDPHHARAFERDRCANHETGLRCCTALPMNDVRRLEAASRLLGSDLIYVPSIANGADHIRYSIGDKLGHPPFLAYPLDQRPDGAIAIAGPGNIVQVGTEQPIEKRIARCLILWRWWLKPAVIDSQMTLQAQFGGGRPRPAVDCSIARRRPRRACQPYPP